MDDESPRHGDVGGEDHPQQERRIENVAVHGGDVRHPAEQVRIPQREAGSLAQRGRRKLAERESGDVLVAPWIYEELSGQRRPGERQGGEGVCRDGNPECASRSRDRGFRCVWCTRHSVRSRVPAVTEAPKIGPCPMGRRHLPDDESRLSRRAFPAIRSRQALPFAVEHRVVQLSIPSSDGVRRKPGQGRLPACLPDLVAALR